MCWPGYESNLEECSMLRRAVLALCVCAYGLCLTGCGSSEDKAANPNNLPYSKEGPPKRNGAPGEKKK